MAMNPLPNESYESWCKRVEQFEYGNALVQLAQGKDIDLILEEMSRKIMEKLLHPLYRKIKDSAKVEYNAEECKRSYLEKMTRRTLVADHVDRD